MRNTIDALIDIIIIAMLVFTAMITVEDVAMRFMIVVVGSGALFNNVKYLYNHFKDDNNTKK